MMTFKEFLTEVSIGDLTHFDKTADEGVFKRRSDVLAWFHARGYQEIGSGLYAIVLQSSDHYIAKVTHSGDTGFRDYAKLTRQQDRKRAHFPQIIAQKEFEVPEEERSILVYFIERLIRFSEATAENFIQTHTKKDVGMFLWIAGAFLEKSETEEVKTLYTVIKKLDPTIELEDVPIHPGYDNYNQGAIDEFYTEKEIVSDDLTEKGTKLMKANNHPFLSAINQIRDLRRPGGMLDTHGGNIMVRKMTYDVVITDPLAL